ncbi:STAS domain-containing protein [Methylotetracoccus oryzae]|uniref:STAS domain-containing protein n=1 Tax=Methylotetracoccus oryzae TaxID=1919059 RepID=UPI0011190189|nr:STAS domain-containing protein [Methylotetracoccus oryzae]
MKVPILRLNRDVLIVPIHADVTDEDVLMFQTDLTEGLARNEARGVVIDVSALDVVDSFMARVLNDTARMLGLMGARVVICGVQPPVALTLVEMGRNLSTIATAFNLELALERLTGLMAQDESLAAQGRERDAAH